MSRTAHVIAEGYKHELHSDAVMHINVSLKHGAYGKTRSVGKLIAKRIDRFKLSDEWEIFSLLDGINQNLSTMASEAMDLIEEDHAMESLYFVERIEINKAHRGNGLGKLMLNSVVSSGASGSGVMFLRPGLLSGRDSQGRLENLQRWYADMGFKKVKRDSPVYYKEEYRCNDGNYAVV